MSGLICMAEFARYSALHDTVVKTKPMQGWRATTTPDRSINNERQEKRQEKRQEERLEERLLEDRDGILRTSRSKAEAARKAQRRISKNTGEPETDS